MKEKIVKKTCAIGLFAAGILLGQAPGRQELSIGDVEKMLAAKVRT